MLVRYVLSIRLIDVGIVRVNCRSSDNKHHSHDPISCKFNRILKLIDHVFRSRCESNGKGCPKYWIETKNRYLRERSDCINVRWATCRNRSMQLRSLDRYQIEATQISPRINQSHWKRPGSNVNYVPRQSPKWHTEIWAGRVDQALPGSESIQTTLSAVMRIKNKTVLILINLLACNQYVAITYAQHLFHWVGGRCLYQIQYCLQWANRTRCIFSHQCNVTW